MRARSIRRLTEKPIRRIKMIIDLENPLNPELLIDDFIKIHGQYPDSPRYRIATIEVVTCSEDLQPVLISECGSCPKFVKRFGDRVSCKKSMSIEY